MSRNIYLYIPKEKGYTAIYSQQLSLEGAATECTTALHFTYFTLLENCFRTMSMYFVYNEGKVHLKILKQTFSLLGALEQHRFPPLPKHRD